MSEQFAVDFIHAYKEEAADTKTEERNQFGTDTSNLMSLIVHAVYTSKDVFIRELISNAADANNKARYEMLAESEGTVTVDQSQFHINMFTVDEKSLLVIEDNGVGMDKDDLKMNLGTIASSGTRKFQEMVTADAAQNSQLIGQFGIGFYSAFLVADYVQVFSRKLNTETTWVWSSCAAGDYSLGEALPEMSLKSNGTRIVLHIKPDQSQYLKTDKIKEIVQKHSTFIDYSINLQLEKSVKESFPKIDAEAVEDMCKLIPLSEPLSSDAFETVGDLVCLKNDCTLAPNGGEWSYEADSKAQGAVQVTEGKVKACKDGVFRTSFSNLMDVYRWQEKDNLLEVNNGEDEWSHASSRAEGAAWLSCQDGFVVTYKDGKWSWAAASDFSSLPASEDTSKATYEKSVEKKVFETLNTTKALWVARPEDCTQEQYNAFYKSLSNDWEEPLHVIHAGVGGHFTYKVLMFIPKRAPFNLFESKKGKSSLKLYVRKVFIKDECDELIPEYFSMVKGIVDAEDLPLTVSRAELQQNVILGSIKQRVTKHIIQALLDMAENEKEKFDTFYSQFSKNVKLGIHEDASNREKLTKLLRFPSMQHKTGQISLDDYIDSMSENQKHIYYVTGEDLDVVSNLPHLEHFRNKNMDVLFMCDPIDEYVVSILKNYNDHELHNITKEGVDLGDSDEEKKSHEALVSEFEALCKTMKDVIGSDVEKVIITNKKVDSPMCMSTLAYSWTANMERIMKAQALRDASVSDFMKSKRVLELNPAHHLIKDLKARLDAGTSQDDMRGPIQMMYNITCVACGHPVKHVEGFTHSLWNLLQDGSKAGLNISSVEDKVVELPPLENADEAENLESLT